jgi:hypothetical protein
MSGDSEQNGTSSSSTSNPTTSGDSTPPTGGNTPLPDATNPPKPSKKVAGPISISPKIELFMSNLKQFGQLAGTLTKSTSEFCAIDQTVNELVGVKQELAEKNDALKEKEKRVKELEKSKKELVDEFQSRYEVWGAKEKILIDEKTKLSESLETTTLQAREASEREKRLTETKRLHEAKIDSLTTLLESRETDLSKLTTQLEVESTKARYAEAQMKSMEKQLERWQAIASSLKDPDFQQLLVPFSSSFISLTITYYSPRRN